MNDAEHESVIRMSERQRSIAVLLEYADKGIGIVHPAGSPAMYTELLDPDSIMPGDPRGPRGRREALMQSLCKTVATKCALRLRSSVGTVIQHALETKDMSDA